MCDRKLTLSKSFPSYLKNEVKVVLDYIQFRFCRNEMLYSFKFLLDIMMVM